MELVEATLSEVPTDANLRLVLRTLGQRCLAARREIELDDYVRRADDHRTVLEAVATLSATTWQASGDSVTGSFDSMQAALHPLRSHPALALLTLLEGICRGAGRNYFTATSRVERIQRGMVLPMPDRHIAAWPATPNPATTHNVLLDPSCGFLIWDSDWTLELDYTFRDRIEGICWRETGETVRGTRLHRLPRISTVHPFTGDEMSEPDSMSGGTFFGVHPVIATEGPTVEDNTRRVADLLVEVGDAADIAIVPEFTMHSPDSMASELVDGQHRPPIVVAGSAHCSVDGVDANMSITYLDAVPVLTTTKYYPFVYRIKAPTPSPTAAGEPDAETSERAPAPLGKFTEQITPRERVLRFVSSDSTRLAVVICSDLNSVELLGVMNSAGVNLLLCPAWTPKVGTFVGALEAMAAYSQCVSVIANTPGHPSAPEDPFWAISMIPREGARPVLHRPGTQKTRAGVADANEEPSDAPPYWTWL